MDCIRGTTDIQLLFLFLFPIFLCLIAINFEDDAVSIVFYYKLPLLRRRACNTTAL